MHFSWELSGSGWATCRIWDGSTKHRDIVSYCTNALADLLKGVTGLYGLHGIQRFSFDLEPAEARWILRRRNSDVHITIRRFPDMSTSFDAPDGKGTLVWTSTRPRTSLAHAVLMAAEQVRRTHGEDGYLQKWQLHAFPTTELETLRHLHLAADDCTLQHSTNGSSRRKQELTQNRFLSAESAIGGGPVLRAAWRGVSSER
ncbi:hypothetical protein ACFUTV_00150 [Streptomyces sp. NPDC057298]|uniref:hypothetical protein n=1 Tax=Streptomyces sp. NPDC057298 TaxID=3346091 RepID=UPI00364431BF